MARAFRTGSQMGPSGEPQRAQGTQSMGRVGAAASAFSAAVAPAEDFLS
jgi:hypothetical protein